MRTLVWFCLHFVCILFAMDLIALYTAGLLTDIKLVTFSVYFLVVYEKVTYCALILINLICTADLQGNFKLLAYFI